MTTGPEPGSDAWMRRVTASKVPAILGLSPWSTPYTAWHQMKGWMPADDGRNGDAKARGHYLEDGVVRWWRDQHPTAGGDTQVWHPVDDWAGATSDFSGVEVRDGDDAHSGERFVLNAKTAASTDDWWTRDGDETYMFPPPHYVASLLFEMWCADADAGYIACLFGRPFEFREWRIERDQGLIDGIVARCRAFYDSLTSDVPPDLDDTLATYETVRRVHADIDPDLVIVLDGPTTVEFVTATEAFDVAERRRREAHSRVLAAMGSARAAQYCGVQVARRQPNRHGVSFVPTVRSLGDLEA